ncbi:RNA 2',3'-cyclic phosphodiesterase [Thalassomonas viridans]|uniref:RNA 2',3'-cyclic phosphodiesterase n=1 Tax=Thalassomonas viridans TaxID=137584 RepID=A0AAF0C8T8_9GAMM|nr:RNA 2',3'-cyclic phosphodiesterase [Thalassomonas viridans]WDE04530.1 RNA 2',3'-cyclic phosphodiesterase [Thalassomonas viridans]
MNRYFFALNLSHKSKKQLMRWRDSELALPNHPVIEDNLHITLAFLGQLSDEQKQRLIAGAGQVADTLRGETITPLTINRLGYFKRPKVLYLANDQIPAWQNKLAAELAKQAIDAGLQQEERRYLSHITLYRKVRTLPKELPLPAINIPIDRFSLFQSVSTETGVRYQPVKTWRLTAHKDNKE